MAEIILCNLDQLEEPGSRGFELESADAELPVGILVVRKGGQVFAYRNQCPHTGVALEWVPHQFLDLDSQFIQCATHGALFKVEDGYCVRGPCAGDSLTSLPVRVEDNAVIVSL